MIRKIVAVAAVALALVMFFTSRPTARAADEPKGAMPQTDWAMNATIIEACSCPMFCQCYFDSKPAAHSGDEHAEHAAHEGHAGMAGMSGGEMYCKFNNAFKVNSGNYGSTKLDGAKFWVAGDLGNDFSQGKMD